MATNAEVPTADGRRTQAERKAVLHRQQLLQIWVGSSDVEAATAGLTCGGQDVEPLHHAEILMVDDMTMRDKAAHGDRIEIHPKCDRARRCQIDVVGWPKTGIGRVGGG